MTGATWSFASPSQASQDKVDDVEKLVRYLANLAVNGHPKELGANPAALGSISSVGPPASVPTDGKTLTGWRTTLLRDGPAGLAKAVRTHKGLLITDTTWRDAHQSLLATRMRSWDLLQVAEATGASLPNLFSLEMWGGATFDVAMRFLHECPWERLEKLRERVPHVPFQMLLRGANAVGYTNYPDNLVYRFCDQAAASGVDIFRVFDSLNYIENLKLGVDAAGAAGGFVEAAICYTGDVANPDKKKYDLDYYVKYALELSKLGVHSIAIKDMAGLLTPRAARMLVGAIRKELPDMPLHIHSHDTGGGSLASMMAAADAGADIVDVAIDGMSGLTSQCSMGAMVAAMNGHELDTGINLRDVAPLNDYWERVRKLYLPFESGQLSGSSDVYEHEIPGGQYTNLLFQASQLGLDGRWSEIKKKYAQANLLLGDIPKVRDAASPSLLRLPPTRLAPAHSSLCQHVVCLQVTPSSKVVGDMAQFMVSQKLSPDDVVAQAETPSRTVRGRASQSCCRYFVSPP